MGNLLNPSIASTTDSICCAYTHIHWVMQNLPNFRNRVKCGRILTTADSDCVSSLALAPRYLVLPSHVVLNIPLPLPLSLYSFDSHYWTVSNLLVSQQHQSPHLSPQHPHHYSQGQASLLHLYPFPYTNDERRSFHRNSHLRSPS